MRRLLLALTLSLVALNGFAAVPKVTITGKVIAPDGLTYAGSINCVMSAPATAMDGGTSVRVQSTGTLTIASDGTVSGALVANDITTPVTSYTCTTRINRTPVYTQTELIYLTTGGGTVDWGAISRPGATPYTPVGVAGSSGAVQASNGSGGLADSGVTATAGALSASSVNGAQFWPLATTLTGTISAGTYDFGEGTYTISGAVTLSSGVHLRGRGPGKTIIQLAADRTGGSVFSINAGSTDVSNITIEDMTIDGNDATWSSSYLLYVTSGATSQLTDAMFRNVAFKGIKSRGLVLTSAARIKVLGCTFNGVGATNPNGTAIYGIYVGQAAKKASSDITIEGNTFTNFGGAAIQPGTASAGITIVTPASGVRINDNHFANFVAANNYKMDAIELNGVTTDMPRQVTVANNTFSAIKGSMVNAEASGGSSNCNAYNTDMGLVVEGNTAADVGYDDTAVHKPGIYICNAKNVVIKGNAISDTAGDGNGTIEVHTTGGTVSGNLITYTVAAASPASVPLYLGGADIVCSGNEIRGGTYGIQAQALTDSRIEQNIFSDQLTYPMFINPIVSGDVSGVVVRNNKMSSSLGTIAHGIYTNGNITNSEFSHNTSAGFSTATVYLSGGASSNAYEFNRNATAINGTLVRSATDLKSMPDASGTVVLDRDGGAGSVAALTSYVAPYGNPDWLTRPAVWDIWSEIFHGRSLVTSTQSGNYSVTAHCTGSGAGTCADLQAYTCLQGALIGGNSVDMNSDGVADLKIGDVFYFGSPYAESGVPPTTKTYVASTIANGAGAGVDECPAGQQKVGALTYYRRSAMDQNADGTVDTGKGTAVVAWQNNAHGMTGTDYLIGYQAIYAPRLPYGTNGPNLIANAEINEPNGLSPMIPPDFLGDTTAATLTTQVPYPSTHQTASSAFCIDGATGVGDCTKYTAGTSGGYLIQKTPMKLQPGKRYVLSAWLWPAYNNTDYFALSCNSDGAATLNAASVVTATKCIPGSTTPQFIEDRNEAHYYWCTIEAPRGYNQCSVIYVKTDTTANRPLIDDLEFRELATYGGDSTGAVSQYLIPASVGTRTILYTGNSWAVDTGATSHGYSFGLGLKAGYLARFGSALPDAQFVASGVNGYKASDLLTNWATMVTQYHPLICIFALGVNDAGVNGGGVTENSYADSIRQVAAKAKAEGCLPIFLSTPPVIDTANTLRGTVFGFHTRERQVLLNWGF